MWTDWILLPYTIKFLAHAPWIYSRVNFEIRNLIGFTGALVSYTCTSNYFVFTFSKLRSKNQSTSVALYFEPGSKCSFGFSNKIYSNTFSKKIYYLMYLEIIPAYEIVIRSDSRWFITAVLMISPFRVCVPNTPPLHH